LSSQKTKNKKKKTRKTRKEKKRKEKKKRGKCEWSRGPYAVWNAFANDKVSETSNNKIFRAY
jgi:hypothetical protein